MVNPHLLVPRPSHDAGSLPPPNSAAGALWVVCGLFSPLAFTALPFLSVRRIPVTLHCPGSVPQFVRVLLAVTNSETLPHLLNAAHPGPPVPRPSVGPCWEKLRLRPVPPLNGMSFRRDCGLLVHYFWTPSRVPPPPLFSPHILLSIQNT